MDNREIDRLIAEKVFNWEWREREYNPRLFRNPPPTYHVWWDKVIDNVPALCLTEKTNYKTDYTPPFSTDLLAAWEVVLKVCEETRWYELTFRPTGAIADFMGDNFHRGVVPFKEVGDDRTRAQCKAICIAALKAVGVEVT